MKKEIQLLSIKELIGVNGGNRPPSKEVQCPNCGELCLCDSDIIVEGSGCDQQTYMLCPKCGYRWK